MTKRGLAWFVVVIFVLASLAIGAFGLSGTRTVRIGEAEIQKRIDSRLPMSSSKGVTLTKAAVQVNGKDVGIQLSLVGKALGQPFALEASGVGVPEYRREEQAFFFRPSKLVVTKLELSGESSTDKVGKFADRYITDPRLKERIAGSLPGAKQWVEDNLEPRALLLFAAMPLYQPKNDMKGIIIKATLESLAVDNGAIVLSFSLLQLTKTFFLCLLTLLCALGMGVILLRNPGWGLALLLLS